MTDVFEEIVALYPGWNSERATEGYELWWSPDDKEDFIKEVDIIVPPDDVIAKKAIKILMDDRRLCGLSTKGHYKKTIVEREGQEPDYPDLIKLASFGYKKQPKIPPSWEIIDCRRLDNPHRISKLRNLTGEDTNVMNYIMDSKGFTDVYGEAMNFIKLGQTKIAFGCYGGKHRSVAMLNIVSIGAKGHGVGTIVTKKF